MIIEELNMSLQSDIDQYKAGFIQKVPEDVLKQMMQATQDLADSGITANAPKVGEKLANFSLPNQLGEQVSLADLTADGAAVITFYRGGWCPYCNLELSAFQKSLADIKAAGASLVAITPELPDESLSTAEKNELDFHVLSDVDANYARELGLVFSLPEELRPVYLSFGIDVEKHNGAGQFDLPLAATFVVDQSGTIISSFADVDYTARQEPTEIVKVLQGS